DRVQVTGFGSFESTKRPGRKGLNPATGESLYIKTKFVPKFHPGKGLKDEVAKRRK
ncbi:MAG TPA: HU family DNA-binding protein, partial [Actinobacteria bacterium]|nr:HU family DNA-binding protein [Actinomycetota bacterium]